MLEGHEPRRGRPRRARVVAFRRRRPVAVPARAARPEDDLTAREARRLRVATRTILAVGFGAALVVWVLAQARPANPLGYDPLDTKKYVHDLQVYGGTANVLAAEFREWFTGLWYGKNLAYTIAVLTVLLVLIVRFYIVTDPAVADLRGKRPPEPPRPVA